MGKLQVGRHLSVDADPETVKGRLKAFARLYGFALREEERLALEFTRGSVLGNLLSFDVQNVTTRLAINLAPSGSTTEITAKMTAASPVSIFTGGDRAALERQMDILAQTVGEVPPP